MTHLITPTIFQEYEDISVNIKPGRLKAFIKKAQDLDLKPFLGHALYYDLLKYVTADGTMLAQAPQHYQNLLMGCQYQDAAGHTIIFEGLAPTLVYFAFARFIEADAVHYTPTGPVVKRYDNAEAVAAKDVVKLVQQHRGTANAHANEVEKFLTDHQHLFPLWQFNSKNKSSRQAGPRIRAVDKTAFNYPADHAQNDYLTINQFII